MNATTGRREPILQNTMTKECPQGARCRSRPRDAARARNALNRCLLLLSKFHYSHDTPSYDLDTQHIFSGAGMGWSTTDRERFEPVAVRAEQHS